MTIASTIVGRILQEKWSSPYSQQKNPKWSTWVQSQKRQNDLCSFPKQPLNIRVIQAYAQVTKAEEAQVEQFYEDLQDLPELIPKKRCLFHHRGLAWKSRKSRDTWTNRRVQTWSTKQSRKRITEFCQKNAMIIVSTLFQKHKRIFYTWTSPDG